MNTRLDSSTNKEVLAAHLDRAEWDFSDIPSGEIEACFFYECCREWTSLHQALREYQAKDLDQVAGVPIDPTLKLLLAVGSFTEVTFQTPWSKLPSTTKESALLIITPGLDDVGFKSASLHRAIFDQCHRSYRSRTNASATNYALFRLEWKRSDGQLVEEFTSWLKSQRPFEAHETRGTHPENWLRMFGAMRLLHHHSLEEAYELTKQSGIHLYGKRPSWERSRKGALEAFQNRFFIDHRMFDFPQIPASYPKLGK